MMTQTLALLLDAYRELNAKKLFWISLILSLLIVVGIGAIGLDRQGFSIFGFTLSIFPADGYAQMSDTMLNQARSDLYQELFDFVGVQIWLTWAAIILALFSTAGIFPDLMSSGTIDTLLTKPIGRLRLFLTKYLLGLGFVGLQVAVFSIGAFFIVGVRAGDWEPKLFLAIPIVLLFFSYLYAVCVLVGVLTRSTLLAVIVTGLIWVVMIALNFTDSTLLTQQAQSLVSADIAERRQAYLETLPTRAQEQDALDQNGGTLSPGASGNEVNGTFDQFGSLDTREGYAATFGDAQSLQAEAEYHREMAAELDKWRGYAYLVKTPLPKTSETANLMSFALTDQEDLEGVTFDPSEPLEMGLGNPLNSTYTKLIQKKTMQLQREQRGWVWVVLTSLLFEFAVVGVAVWRFCRRDY